jgi:CP family cyanate transporter-like MFS transporter
MMDRPKGLTRPALLIAGLLLIAASMRAPIIGVAPVLAMIQDTFDLTQAQAGALTTLPLLAFAALSPFAATIAGAFGLERSLFAAVIVIALGIAVRSLGSTSVLYIGTWVIGCGIAICNVLLPSLIKRDFPRKVPAVTGACGVTMGASAALASAIMVPLAELPAVGWPLALASMIALPLVTMVLWLSQLGSHTAPAPGMPPPLQGKRIWHFPLAWQVTLFMGTNSFLYYTMAGWFPSMLTSSGFSAVEAGSFHGMMQLASTVPGLFLAPIVNRLKDQRMFAVAVAAMMGTGPLGILLAPSLSLLWAVTFGLGAGTSILLALTFLALRVSTPQQAAALSGMAQGIGYLFAASGPFLAGKAHDLSGSWALPLLGCIALSAVLAFFGSLAGRNIQIGGAPHKPMAST